jgi:hypothetical protein
MVKVHDHGGEPRQAARLPFRALDEQVDQVIGGDRDVALPVMQPDALGGVVGEDVVDQRSPPHVHLDAHPDLVDRLARAAVERPVQLRRVQNLGGEAVRVVEAGEHTETHFAGHGLALGDQRLGVAPRALTVRARVPRLVPVPPPALDLRVHALVVLRALRPRRCACSAPAPAG